TTITVRHAEVLDKQGNFYTENLRGAQATDRYTLNGEGEETFEPHFTFQGFRYVAASGYPGGDPPLDAVTGGVVHADTTPTGPLHCDVAGFFTKWLGDVIADQKPNGSVPFVIPDVLSKGQPTGGGATGWADVAVIVPWTVYQAYGDTRILERQYPSMRKWVEYMRAQAGDSLLWKSGFHFGDWLAFASTASDYPGATTDKDFLATAYFAHSTDLLSRAAEVFGKRDEATAYRTLLE